MEGGAARLDAVAARHGFSRGAVAALAEGLQRGGNRMAQFSHPELGGMGQWSGGMLQIGTMFDHALKARVAAALADLAALGPGNGEASPPPSGRSAAWWPEELGQPSSSGAQDGMRYACFPEVQRLVVVRDGRVTLYDTGHYRISGVSQAQARGGTIAFTGQDGIVCLERLRVIGSEALTPS